MVQAGSGRCGGCRRVLVVLTWLEEIYWVRTEVSRAAHPGPGARTGPGAETPDRDKRQPPRGSRGERGGQEMKTGGALGTWPPCQGLKLGKWAMWWRNMNTQRLDYRVRECQFVLRPGLRVTAEEQVIIWPKTWSCIDHPVWAVSWGRHQRHAMRWEAAELTERTFPSSVAALGGLLWTTWGDHSQPRLAWRRPVCGDWGGHQRMPRCSQLPSSQSPHLLANFCEYWSYILNAKALIK